MDIYEKYEKSLEYLKKKTSIKPEIGIIFGSGLGKMADKFEDKEVIPYSSIPDFPQSTVEGHAGNFVFGKLSGKNVVGMQGRFHFYEGYDMNDVTLPVRVMKGLGIKLLILTNASGGLNPDFEPADLMILTDHINMLPNPLLGKNEIRFGPRFPGLKDLYSKELRNFVFSIAEKCGVSIQKGVYLATTGPSYETDAEIRYFRSIGADAVGMSTAPEAVIARHCGIENIIGISCITNMAIPDMEKGDTHQDVIKTADRAFKKFSSLITNIVEDVKL